MLTSGESPESVAPQRNKKVERGGKRGVVQAELEASLAGGGVGASSPPRPRASSRPGTDEVCEASGVRAPAPTPSQVKLGGGHRAAAQREGVEWQRGGTTHCARPLQTPGSELQVPPSLLTPRSGCQTSPLQQRRLGLGGGAGGTPSRRDQDLNPRPGGVSTAPGHTPGRPPHCPVLARPLRCGKRAGGGLGSPGGCQRGRRAPPGPARGCGWGRSRPTRMPRSAVRTTQQPQQLTAGPRLQAVPRFTGQPGAHSSSELRQVQEEAVCSRPSTSSGSLPGSPGPAPGLPPAVPLSIFILHESLALSPLQKVRHGKGSPLPKQLE